MIETVLALIFLTLIFFVAFLFSQMLQARTLLDHAAARAARARAVGLSNFMCTKSARVAMIPVAGKRLWPAGAVDEMARVPIYMESEHGARAAAILDYDRWHTTDLELDEGDTIDARVRMRADGWSMDGSAQIESHYPLYMVHGSR